MATLVIGDVQGCLEPLQRLLSLAQFDAQRDRLWFLGDIVNRGPDSLGVLRFARSLGERVVVTLGNHDLHLLAIVFGGHAAKRKDTLAEVLRADDGLALCHWLRQQPLVWFDADTRSFLAHAGLPHLWSVDDALLHAAEVQAAIRGPDFQHYFASMYGDVPARWEAGLSGMDRLRAITNYFTRMRWIRADGTLEFQHKGELSDRPAEHEPWFKLRHPDNAEVRLLFGHWAALDGDIDRAVDVVALDTGCVWGRRLSALRLEDGMRFSVSAEA